MHEVGIVKTTAPGQAQIALKSTLACEGCGQCVFGTGGEMLIWAADTIGAKIGDTVELEISGKLPLHFYFIVFMLPVLFLFSGYFAGILLAAFFKLISLGEVFGVVFSLVFLLLSTLIIKIIDNYFKSRQAVPAAIIKIL